MTPPLATQPRSPGLVVWAALVCVYIVWGSTYLAIRVVVTSEIPPMLGMGLRFLVAGALMLGFLALRGGPRSLRVTRRELRGAAIMGVLLLVLGNGVVAIAEQTVPSGLAALIIGAVPLCFVVLRASGGDRPRRMTWLGVLVGFGGIAVISLPRGGIDDVEFWGVGLLLLACVSWSIGSYVSPRLGLPANGLLGAGYEMLLAGAIMVVVSAASGSASEFAVDEVPPEGWWALAYLIVIGSLLGYTAYGYLLANAPLSLVGTYAYVNPVVAVFLGWAILSEPLTGIVAAGGALVVVGVILVVGGERRRRPKREDPALLETTAQRNT